MVLCVTALLKYRPRLDREMNMHPCELPDHVVVALLKREALLNRVRLHAVQIQHIISNERLRHLQTKQCQVCACTPSTTGFHDTFTCLHA